MITGLIVYRQILRKTGFTCLECFRSPMTEITGTIILPVVQKFLPLKLQKLSFLPAFFYQGWPRDGSTRQTQPQKGSAAGGQMVARDLLRKR